MTFRVRTLRRANADILSITDYIHGRSKAGADAWVNALERAKKRLAKNADSCSEADENHRFEIEVKQSLFETRRGRVYRLVFTIVSLGYHKIIRGLLKFEGLASSWLLRGHCENCHSVADHPIFAVFLNSWDPILTASPTERPSRCHESNRIERPGWQRPTFPASGRGGAGLLCRKPRSGEREAPGGKPWHRRRGFPTHNSDAPTNNG